MAVVGNYGIEKMMNNSVEPTPEEIKKAIEVKDLTRNKEIFIRRFTKLCVKAGLDGDKTQAVFIAIADAVEEESKDVEGLQKRIQDKLQEMGINSKDKRKKLARESLKLVERYVG